MIPADILFEFSLVPISEPQPQMTGLSASYVWRISTHQGTAAVRRWSKDTPVALPLAIHSLLDSAEQRGLVCVPKPWRSREGKTLVIHHDQAWEALDWKPGVMIPPNPTNNELEQAGETIARWHQMGLTLPLPQPAKDYLGEPPRETRQAPPAGLSRCREWARLEPRMNVVRSAPWDQHDLARRTRQMIHRLHSNIETWLQQCSVPDRLVLVHGDLRREHMFFQNGRVSGLIDFGNIHWDSPAMDLARWLGEAAPFSTWSHAVSGYRRVLRLSQQAEESIFAFFGTGLCLSSLRWLDWLSTMDPSEPRFVAGYHRWNEIVDRLELLGNNRF
jgi:Ser/Thr protein kinase RdoA (MazF antagonist)